MIGISVYDWVDNCRSAAAGFLYIWRHCSLKHPLSNWEALPYSEFPSIHALQPLKTNINSPNDSPSNIQLYSSSPPQHNHRVFPTSCLWSKKNKRKWQKQKQLYNLYRRPKDVSNKIRKTIDCDFKINLFNLIGGYFTILWWFLPSTWFFKTLKATLTWRKIFEKYTVK